MSQSEGAKAAGWGLAIIGLIQFIIFLIFELYFLIFIPILLLTIGAILIGITLNKDDTITIGYDPDKKEGTVQPDLSTSKTETKTDGGPISHDSEEYRRWKEGK